LVCLLSRRELPEMKADSFHQPDDFAFLMCQNEMKEMNMGKDPSPQLVAYSYLSATRALILQ
jgi:hypothetical protein